MITVRTKDGSVFVVKSGALAFQEKTMHNSLVKEFQDKNVRALLLDLDPSYHNAKSVAVLCEDIQTIVLK